MLACRAVIHPRDNAHVMNTGLPPLHPAPIFFNPASAQTSSR